MNARGKPAIFSTALAVSLPALLALATPALALAGDMDGVGIAILMLYLYIGVAIVGGIGALVACRWISDAPARLLARWLIVVVLYTPVPFEGSALPAFLVAWSNPTPAHSGVLGHPLLLAYAGALLLSGPVVALWLYVSGRYSGVPRLDSQTQRTSVARSPAAQAPPT